MRISIILLVGILCSATTAAAQATEQLSPPRPAVIVLDESESPELRLTELRSRRDRFAVQSAVAGTMLGLGAALAVGSVGPFAAISGCSGSYCGYVEAIIGLSMATVGGSMLIAGAIWLGVAEHLRSRASGELDAMMLDLAVGRESAGLRWSYSF